jgi:hypothetical protein
MIVGLQFGVQEAVMPPDPIALVVAGVIVVFIFWMWAALRVGDRYDQRR